MRARGRFRERRTEHGDPRLAPGGDGGTTAPVIDSATGAPAPSRHRARRFGGDTFRSLSTPNFRRYFIGQALSQNGTWMQLVALDILVLQITDDGFAVGLATAARFFPMLLLGAWSGVLSDRTDRHRLLIRLNVGAAIVATLFALLVATGNAVLWLIYLLAAVSGVFTALESPSRRALVVDLVDASNANNAVGLNSAMMTGSKILGPAVAGVLITTLSVSWCFAVNAISYIPQVVLFLRMDRSAFRQSVRVAKAKGQLREGFRYVWATPDMRRPLLMIAAIGTLTFNYSVILPLLAIRDLGGGPGTYTLLLSIMSIGSVAGALIVARRENVNARYLAHSAFALAIACLALAAAPNLVSATILVVPVGISTLLVISGANSMVQLGSAPAMRGRVLAMLSIVFVGSTPIGGPIIGWVAEDFGARWALVVGGVTALVASLLTLRALRASPTAGAGGDERAQDAPSAGAAASPA